MRSRTTSFDGFQDKKAPVQILKIISACKLLPIFIELGCCDGYKNRCESAC